MMRSRQTSPSTPKDRPQTAPLGRTATLIASAAIAAISISIGYNALFGQSDVPRLPGMDARYASASQALGLGALIANTEDEKPENRSGYPKITAHVSPPHLPPGQGQNLHAAAVASAQRQLALLGYYNGEVNGIPDTATQAAVSAFEVQTGLPVSGAITARLLEQLRYQQKIVSAAFPSPEPVPQKRKVLPIQEVQTRLAELGYRPGPVDGRLGSMTRRAILSFQKDRGLGQDGAAGPALLAELRRAKGNLAYP